MSEPVTWYIVERWNITRKPVTVLAETDKTLSVTGFDGRPERVAKRSEYRRYFPTEAEAIAYLLDRERGKIENLKRQLQEARTAVGELEAWNFKARSA